MPWPPPKMTSCIDWPRTASGDCSPIAHSTVSVMSDLPEPFGPTTTLTPEPKSSRARSGKDLKPFNVSDFRCTRDLAFQPFHCLASRPLLGVLLAPAAAAAQRPAIHARHDRVRALVRRSLLPGDRVADRRAASCQQLLQRGLEVHRMLQSLLDLRFE